MKAVRIETFGGSESLRLQDIAVPTPGQGEVLLRVRAAGINPVDYKIRSGAYPAVTADKLPYVLGRDVSGVVERLGPGVSAFAEGDALYGVPGVDRGGGYAEYAVLKIGGAAHKPNSLDYAAAAAVPLAGLTAWQGLFRYGRLEAGQRVLVHAGAGGVGHFAIQFAKAKGAYVITTASGDHIDFVRKLGADEAIDYKKQRFEEEVRDIDLVFDLVAGETQDRSWGVLRKGGALISTLRAPSPEKAAEYGVRAMRYTVEESGSELTEIANLIDAGRVKPFVAKTFPLNEAAAAQQMVEQGHTQGKIVLTISRS